MTSVSVRVRVAEFPARSVAAPNHSSTSTASPGAPEEAPLGWSEGDVMLFSKRVAAIRAS
jgi:hypothetical protein